MLTMFNLSYLCKISLMKLSKFWLIPLLLWINLIVHIKPMSIRGLDNNNNCSLVHQMFSFDHHILSRYIQGDRLEICPSRSSCCTSNSEIAFKRSAKRNIKTMIQNISNFLRNFFVPNYQAFTVKIQSIILSSKNLTITSILHHYPSFDISSVAKFFDTLLIQITKEEKLNIVQLVKDFFDNLFLDIHFFEKKNPRLDPKYIECVKDSMLDITPFGDLPSTITLELREAFEVAWIAISSIQLGIKVINETFNYQLSEECYTNLVKLIYCPYCQGYIQLKPCSGYCLNVIRGCVSQLSKLDKPWNDYITSLKRLSDGMVGSYNLQNILTSLADKQILEAITSVFNNSNNFKKRVKVACGPLNNYPIQNETLDSAKFSSQIGHISDNFLNNRTYREASTNLYITTPSLYISLETYVHQLEQYKGYFASLADSICSHENFSSKSDNECWNGHSIGEYTQTVVDTGLSNQKFNPEIKMNDETNPNVHSLVESLKDIKEQVRSKFKQMPDSHPYLHNLPSDTASDGQEGSGHFNEWGEDRNYLTDDEDYSNENYDSSGDGHVHPEIEEVDNSLESRDHDINFDLDLDQHRSFFSTDLAYSLRLSKLSFVIILLANLLFILMRT